MRSRSMTGKKEREGNLFVKITRDYFFLILASIKKKYFIHFIWKILKLLEIQFILGRKNFREFLSYVIPTSIDRLSFSIPKMVRRLLARKETEFLRSRSNRLRSRDVGGGGGGRARERKKKKERKGVRGKYEI